MLLKALPKSSKTSLFLLYNTWPLPWNSWGLQRSPEPSSKQLVPMLLHCSGYAPDFRPSNDTRPIQFEMYYSLVRRNFFQMTHRWWVKCIWVLSAVGYRRWTVLDLSTFYITLYTHYIGCRFEQGENVFPQNIQIHEKSTPRMILSLDKLRFAYYCAKR